VKENKEITQDLVVKIQKRISIGTAYFYTNKIMCFEFDNDILMGLVEIKELADTVKEMT